MRQAFIHCALSAEARPLIDAHRLKQIESKPFAVYQRENDFLVVSGIGKLACAAAIAYVYGKYAHPNDVWINVGVCGAKGYETGKTLLVNKLIDVATSKTFYPPLPPLSNLESEILYCVDTPELAYNHPGLYDMEASAFYFTANRFSTAELVQSIKTVSDTDNSGIGHVDKAYVIKCVDALLQPLQSMKAHLLELAESLPSDELVLPIYHELCKRFHFSATQQRQLLPLLNRMFVLQGPEINLDEMAKIKSSAEVLSQLTQRVENIVPEF